MTRASPAGNLAANGTGVEQLGCANSPKLALPRVKSKPRAYNRFGQVPAMVLINVVEKMITRCKDNKKSSVPYEMDARILGYVVTQLK